jgi:hypothetical protein
MRVKEKRPRFEILNNGFVAIYRIENVSEVGFKPVNRPILHQKYPFNYQTVGVKRAYEAAQAQCRLDELIKIPLDRAVSTQDIAVIDCIQYEIKLVQHKYDTLPPTSWLSLVRLEAAYEDL